MNVAVALAQNCAYLSSFLPPGASVPIRTETENVGVDGFFCYSRHLFSRFFLLVLPSAPVDSARAADIQVGGEAEIARVSVGHMPVNYGVACRLRSYHILPASDLLPVDEILSTMTGSAPITSLWPVSCSGIVVNKMLLPKVE